MLEALLEIVGCATGHVVLWALSLGRWRPFQEGDSLATLAGLAFWAALGLGLSFLLAS